ncbi:MAG: DUF72 domain-containing protein [Pyrinomonadaceae bacterium]|nr:DUF72 domain-containing protein [Pyrinomonadaceae bacterium]MDQ3585100.1 DUF72 domain-containing protein [Acidobacteriota bacterium]
MNEGEQQLRVQVGCQGWNYEDWITGPASDELIFYPRGTRAVDMLAAYARAFQTVEVDSTFYAVPAAATVDQWHKRTPPHFTFALKLPREITHESGLRAASSERLAEFCDHARLLQDKLAAVLVQLPPQFEAVPENFRALQDFLPRLPRDIRFSVEFRHDSWLQDDVIELLNRHHVALALVEGQWLAHAQQWRFVKDLTANFAYIRWMGARDLTRFDRVQRPQDRNLQLWAEALQRLAARGPHVFAYFSNFYEGHAPASANKLKRLLDQSIITAADLENQPSLF